MGITVQTDPCKYDKTLYNTPTATNYTPANYICARGFLAALVQDDTANQSWCSQITSMKASTASCSSTQVAAGTTTVSAQPAAAASATTTSIQNQSGSGLGAIATINLKGGRTGNYCSNGTTGVVCNRDSVGASETFDFQVVSNDQVSIKANNGKYCSDDTNGFICNRDSVGAWEKFNLTELGNNQISIKGNRSGKYCSDDTNGIVCNRDSVGAWEKFTGNGGGGGSGSGTTVIGNYTEFTRKDKGGNDIKTVTTGISDCKRECDKDSNCKGVVLIPSSGACYLKSDVTNPYTWDDRTMYIKAESTPSGYTKYGYDYRGDPNIRVGLNVNSISECATKCNEDPKCKYFGMESSKINSGPVASGTACYLKYDNVTAVTSDTNWSTFEKQNYTQAATVWTPQGHWRDNGGRTIPNDLGMVTSVQACKDKAIASNYNVIGLQANGECWGGLNNDYSFLGSGTGTAELGEGWDNNVFTTSTFAKSTKNQAALDNLVPPDWSKPFRIRNINSGKYLTARRYNGNNGNYVTLYSKHPNMSDQTFYYDVNKQEIQMYDDKNSVINIGGGNLNGGWLIIWNSNNNDSNNKFRFDKGRIIPVRDGNKTVYLRNGTTADGSVFDVNGYNAGDTNGMFAIETTNDNGI